MLTITRLTQVRRQSFCDDIPVGVELPSHKKNRPVAHIHEPAPGFLFDEYQADGLACGVFLGKFYERINEGLQELQG